MATAGDIVTNALMEIGWLGQGETAQAGDSDFVLGKLNDLVDEWNSRKLFIYNVNFSQFTLVPNLHPHTIGLSTNSPAPTFTVTGNRPVAIENASIVLNNVTPNVTVPITIRDDDWWANQRVKTLAAALPSDLYYSPDFPNGSLYFWPVPNIAYLCELELRNLLTSFANTATTFSMPPAYKKALTLTLAEDICPAYGRESSPTLQRKSRDARAAVQGANSEAPRISTKDFGLPSSGSRNRTNWFYPSGTLK